ncbi:glycosyl transferase [Polaribacter pacificus]|uniref:Glycosyl transferase n=1 Tax=Polaribacter pacificus TaxID=1775173 RepID=A0A917HX85_9FLAO|nr:glycosyltransferase family 2 protein [Polaribacter pacificus]GGG93656.1 glycosyl transferase [Polaribacter pacificus]
MEKKTFFTIITATFNSEKTLKNTIESVLNQRVTNFEYILVDGKSTDKTLEIIKSYENSFKEKGISYRWISEKDTGIYNAFNKGIHLSFGRWISFLGSDDYYTINALEVYYNKLLTTNQSIDFCYSNVQMIDGPRLMNVINGVWNWSIFKKYMNIAHVGAFHNKAYFTKFGFFDESYTIAGDYELLLRARQDLKTIKADETTVYMSAGGVSNNQVFKAFKETFNAKLKTGKRNLILCSFDYVLALTKYFIKKVLHATVR